MEPMYYECIVEMGRKIQKIVRFFDSAEYAFAWLELEGYKVISLKELPKE